MLRTPRLGPSPGACSDNPFRPPPKEDMLFIPVQERQRHLEERARIREMQVWEKTTLSWQMCPQMRKPASWTAAEAEGASGEGSSSSSADRGQDAQSGNQKEELACLADGDAGQEGAVVAVGSEEVDEQSVETARSLKRVMAKIGAWRLRAAESAAAAKDETDGIAGGGNRGGAAQAGSEDGPDAAEAGEAGGLFTRSAHQPIACSSFRRALAEKRRGVHAKQVRMEIDKEQTARRKAERDLRKQRSEDAMALMRAAMKANSAGNASVLITGTSARKSSV